MQLIQPICYCFCVYKDLEFFLRFLNRASKLDQGVVKSPKCRLYILIANPNYKDILYQVHRSAADLIYSLFFTCCKFVHFFILLLLATFYYTFSHLSFLINSLLYKQNFIWSKATKKNWVICPIFINSCCEFHHMLKYIWICPSQLWRTIQKYGFSYWISNIVKLNRRSTK
jgi:hypothetical protein